MSGDVEALAELFAPGADRARIVAAAESLRFSDSVPTGRPPPAFIAALIDGGPALEQALLDLARAWSRPDMSRAALDALAAATTPHDREQAAWLLKTVLAEEHAANAIAVVLDRREHAEVRRWLVEALERVLRGGTLGWDQLDRVVVCLAAEHAPPIRVALASLLSTLPWRPDNASLLEGLLLDDNHEVVSAAAATLARRPDAARALQPATLDRLRSHPNPMMRQSAAMLEAAINRGPR